MDVTVHANTHFWNVNFFDVLKLIKKKPQITHHLKEAICVAVWITVFMT